MTNSLKGIKVKLENLPLKIQCFKSYKCSSFTGFIKYTLTKQKKDGQHKWVGMPQGPGGDIITILHVLLYCY